MIKPYSLTVVSRRPGPAPRAARALRCRAVSSAAASLAQPWAQPALVMVTWVALDKVERSRPSEQWSGGADPNNKVL